MSNNKTRMNQVVPELVVATPEPGVNAAPSIVTTPGIHRRSTAGALSIISNESTRSAHIVDSEQRDNLEIVKLSQERKDFLSIIRPGHTKQISGWTTKGYYASTTEGCPPGMEALSNLSEFYISRAGNKFDEVYGADVELGPAKYQVSGDKGQVLFFAVETLQANEFYPSRVRTVDMTVTGSKGGIVFQISGTNKSAQVKNDVKTLGTITRYGAWFQASHECWSYKIYDAKGMEVGRFHRDKVKGQYTLQFPGVNSAGEARENPTKTYKKPNTADPDNILGVELGGRGSRVSAEQKTLILAASLLIFDKHSKTVDFGPNKTRFKHGVIYNLCIGAILLILIIAIIAATNSGTPTRKHHICPKAKKP